MSFDQEVLEHRMRDTAGGYDWSEGLWCDVRDRYLHVASSQRLTAAEVVEELEWMRDGGLAAWEAVKALGRTPVALEKLCFRQGRSDLALWIRGEVRRVA